MLELALCNKPLHNLIICLNKYLAYKSAKETFAQMGHILATSVEQKQLHHMLASWGTFQEELQECFESIFSSWMEASIYNYGRSDTETQHVAICRISFV